MRSGGFEKQRERREERERKRGRETESQRVRKGQRERKGERQKEGERQRGRETEREGGRETALREKARFWNFWLMLFTGFIFTLLFAVMALYICHFHQVSKRWEDN